MTRLAWSSRHRWRLVLLAAALVHAWVFWSILRQPLDANVPPRSPRAATWSLSYDSVNSPGPGADFMAVYHAGVQASRGDSPYTREESPQVTPYYFIYRYPPVVGQTLGRMAVHLSPLHAYRTWILVVEASMVALLFALRRQAMPEGAKTAALAALLLSTPYFLELHMGQFTFFSAAVAALAILALHDGGGGLGLSLLAAIPLTAVSVLKQFPSLVAVGLVATRRGRAAGVLTLAATAAILAPGLLDDATRHEFARLNVVDNTIHLYPGNFGLLYQVFATWVFLGSPLSQGVLARVSAVGGLLLVAAVGAGLACARTNDVRRIAGTLLAAFFLAYFRVWEHHYVAVMVGGVLVLTSIGARDDRPARTERSLLLFGLVLLASPTVFRWLPADPATWSPAQHYLLAYPKIAGAAAIVLAGMQPAPCDGQG